MPELVELIRSRHALKSAWREVIAGKWDGHPSALTRFDDALEDNIDELREQLIEGTYRPGDLTDVTLLLGDKERTLHIPTARDRLVERTILEAIGPHVDPHLGHAAYAYRPGLGVADAVNQVALLRDEGMTHALRADVDDCFPSIPVGRAIPWLLDLLPDRSLDELIEALFGRLHAGPKGRGIVRGAPLGCALSPLLANVWLRPLDDALLKVGFPMVRYADDFVVPVHGVRGRGRSTLRRDCIEGTRHGHGG